MTLKLIKDGKTLKPETQIELDLAQFCAVLEYPITFEWINGQYYLHSDIPKEKPISIKIDEELTRHEAYFKRSSIQKELLARAIGVKGAYRPEVVDLTAGLLGDSLLFLSFGCNVRAIERNPIVAFLIESALANSQHPFLERFKFERMSAQEFLENNTGEILYFDPMFEDENEKTAPRKEMRIFRTLIGEDADAKEIFKKALVKNQRRVVVKRPKLSQKLGEEKPLQYVGKSTRYDVYLSV
jgi:16S rRNA (guanine1516-N2)-methyltransferase